jgi:hypothetical protein
MQSLSGTITATCKHCGSELRRDSFAVQDRSYLEASVQATKKMFQRLFPKFIKIKVTTS